MVGCFTITGESAPCGLWQSLHLILPSMIGWCEGLNVSARMCWWQVPQTSDWFGWKVVVNLLIVTACAMRFTPLYVGTTFSPCMLWQLLHATSFIACCPEVQKARLRLLLWQVMQTAVCAAAGLPLPKGFSGFFDGSLRCSDASPWQAWHMLPLASFLAPCAVRSIECHLSSWQLAHTGWTWAGPFAEYDGD